MTIDLDHLDGRVGEAWSGDVPNGSHVNVVLARRGSIAAGVVVSPLANPRPGHAPVVVCLGAGNAVRPVTVMTNKATASGDRHERMTWGAAQLGIGQGVMDAVKFEVLPGDQAGEILILVAVWVDPEANDETLVRLANRDATRRAIEDALLGAPPADVKRLVDLRDSATNVFYGGE
jgi:5,6,7,8-tetrahydromethanopterin hydro-lyase